MPTPNLLERSGGTSGTTHTTGSLTPDTSKPVTIALHAVRNGDPGVPIITGTNGWNGVSWVEEEHLYDTYIMGSLYTGTPVSGVAGTITATWGGVILARVVDVTEWADGDTSALTANSGVASGNAAAVSGLSLSAMAGDSETYIATGIRDANDAIANEGGSWADLGTTFHTAASSLSAMAAWLNGEDTSPTQSWTDTVRYVSVGCEIKAEAIGGTILLPILNQGLFTRRLR